MFSSTSSIGFVGIGEEKVLSRRGMISVTGVAASTGFRSSRWRNQNFRKEQQPPLLRPLHPTLPVFPSRWKFNAKEWHKSFCTRECSFNLPALLMQLFTVSCLNLWSQCRYNSSVFFKWPWADVAKSGEQLESTGILSAHNRDHQRRNKTNLMKNDRYESATALRFDFLKLCR